MLPIRFPGASGTGIKLTKATVTKLRLPADKGELIAFDEDLPGFGLRLRDGGSATWVAQYRAGAPGPS